MRILVSGASGFLGKPLVQLLQAQGHRVLPLIRGASQSLDGFDSVINLAGESIFSWRWTKEKKYKILTSRTDVTHLLSTMAHPPKVFLSASALGYYGNSGEEPVDEASPSGQGFLAHVCREWEEACQPMPATRIVHPRFGIVLGKGGGALQAMLTPYRLGLGGKLGDGRQWISWIALEDALSAISFALTHPSIEGPFIAASPNPVRQEDFSRQLAHLLHRPACLSLPKWLLRLLFGQAADELLLQSVKAVPKKLLQAGFHFQKTTLDSALHAAL